MGPFVGPTAPICTLLHRTFGLVYKQTCNSNSFSSAVGRGTRTWTATPLVGRPEPAALNLVVGQVDQARAWRALSHPVAPGRRADCGGCSVLGKDVESAHDPAQQRGLVALSRCGPGSIGPEIAGDGD